ncbi:hypothetical protein ASF60_13365 [Methylobacterium sp. Leaf113]|uniref:alpha/beta fold hydrolase n=1 Tax=Methylobacterium sp. Leaf113 TaxID=1736259 RepID=UPI0006F6347A|nr:alpha/beta hydrolase [Methylobacterium sp. Leaf113]KQP94093.1 hypothetical protein ASF60_13365 [Methylobacterium sp. Leaf113]
MGPADGPTVLLLHGWPDDATAWANVAERLNEAGFRTVTPELRGVGRTRFRSADTPHTGNSGILANDAVDLMDAMGIETFMVAGHDWGSNAAEAMAVGWPERATPMAMLSTPLAPGGMPTRAFPQCQRQWYHLFQATKRGREAVRADLKGFGRIMWGN